VRPDAVPLVDAFDIPDGVLDSALGRRDGRVYEALWDAAQKEPLNGSQVFDGYWEHLKPLMRGDEPPRRKDTAGGVPTARL
jgi:acyl-CoA oxidase